MRPNRQNIFRTDAAAKLDRLELIAALLERDATNNRAFIAELGAIQRKPGSVRLQGLRKFAGGVRAGVVLAASTTVAVARSRQVHAAIGAVYRFFVDFAIVLSVAGGAVIILTAAFLLTAPPA
jgi:hypothetical protein